MEKAWVYEICELLGQGWVVKKIWLGYLHLVHWSVMGRWGYLHLYSHVCYLHLCVYLQGRSM